MNIQQSWVASANHPASNFPLQNIPYGIFRMKGSKQAGRVGVAIGDYILDLVACVDHGLIDEQHAVWCNQSSLNALMALGAPTWQLVRQQLSALLQAGSPAEAQAENILLPQSHAEMLLPAQIGDYTDAYASIDHATHVGRLFRPDTPLLPNYKHVPIAYHGRSSSIVVSGTPICRPSGQLQDGDAAPVFAPTRRLDYEAEIGVLIGPGNRLGEPIPIDAVSQQLFGYCLVHDWSARDMQRWEYQPLGPFLSKSFATSISPWVIPAAALAAYRIPAFPRPVGDPQPLPYLWDATDQQSGGLDLVIEVVLQTAAMHVANLPAERISRASFARMYWTFAQLVTHHASNGCNLRPGDLIASGTVSDPHPGEQGCLLELSKGGREPITLSNGETRTFLMDGDMVRITAYAERTGYPRIGFGVCEGQIEAAKK